MAAITFTLDLEDYTGVYAADGRWVANSERILDACAQMQLRGTFFCVGRAGVAQALMRRIVAEGHELGLHSYDHNKLTDEDPASYGAKLGDAKKKLEDMTGFPIKGFRAPQFSLTPKSRWAVDVLGELGFAYSSSIIAGQGAFHGYPDKPVTPFRWENGLWELPVPVMRLGKASLPFLGGVYLKFLPLPLVRHFQTQLPSSAVPWTYLHPYDIDHEEGFRRFTDGTPLWANVLLMSRREHFMKKIAALLKDNAGARLIDRLPA
jgi:polysaccharide deacetylase family protein (PEP-CTERM system associated)